MTPDVLDAWLALPVSTRRVKARQAWCTIGSQQGVCAVCWLGFRGLTPFDRGFRKGVEGCLHPDLVREGSLAVLDCREVDGVACPRVGFPDTREASA